MTETRIRMSDGSAYVVAESHKRFMRRWAKSLRADCWVLVYSRETGLRRILNPSQIVAAEEQDGQGQ